MFVKGQSGNTKGRPVGTTTKPRLSDYLTESNVDLLVSKAIEMANGGNEAMLKFVLEHKFGRAAQQMDITSGGERISIGGFNYIAPNENKSNNPTEQ